MTSEQRAVFELQEELLDEYDEEYEQATENDGADAASKSVIVEALVACVELPAGARRLNIKSERAAARRHIRHCVDVLHGSSSGAIGTRYTLSRATLTLESNATVRVVYTLMTY